MFKNNRLAGVLNFRNGGTGPLVVGGSMTLGAALARVDAAEQALADARSAAKAAARRENKPVASLFGDSRFILRASGEKWADEARRAGEKVMADIFTRNLDVDAADDNSPFQHLAKRLKREGAPKPDEMRRHWAALDAAGFLTAARAGDYEEAARIVAEVNKGWAGQSKGEQILAAGKRARMSADAAGEVPEPEGLSAKIVAAGKRARTPTGSHEND
jgi:hypothetical protein